MYVYVSVFKKRKSSNYHIWKTVKSLVKKASYWAYSLGKQGILFINKTKLLQNVGISQYASIEITLY